MTLLPRRMIAATVAADELCVVALALGLRRVRVISQASCAGFSRRSTAELAAALKPIADQPGGLLFVAPTAWCAVKPAQVTRRQWASAEMGLRESIEHLFPIERGDAMLGMVNLHADASPALNKPTGGALVAARRSRLTPTLEALEEALGRGASRVLAAPMALLGLGLQGEARSVVLDSDAHGEAIAHTLAWGLPVALDEPAPAFAAAAGREHTVAALPGAAAPEGARRISAERLAMAGALAEAVAPGAFAPLAGAPPRAQPAWLAPAAVAAAAALLFVASAQVWAARLDAADARVRAELASLEDSLMRAQGHRREAERLERLLRQGVQTTVASWRSPMPLLREIVAALGAEGFYYRIEVGERSALLRGESPNAGAVLQRLTRAPGVAAAEFVAPVSKSTMSGDDVFEIRVRWASRSGG